MAVGTTDSPQASIGKLLRDNVFSVPPYQRDYRWPEDRVSQLFDDIDAAIARRDDRYFLGLMVFMKSGDDGLIVLDGQQRLATVYLLPSCMPQLASRLQRVEKKKRRQNRHRVYGIPKVWRGRHSTPACAQFG